MDGNVYRVLSRYYGIDTPIGTTAAKKEFTALAQSLLPEGRAGDFNQGVMDFGAIQCSPQSPACLTCPLAERCEALRTGRVELLPVKKAGPAIQDRYLTCLYLRCDGQTAIRRRPPGSIWQGLWEPFLIEHADASRAEPWPAWAKAGNRVPLRTGVKHQLTHRTLHADFYLCETGTPPALPEGFIWIPEADLERYAKPRLFELLLNELNKSHIQ